MKLWFRIRSLFRKGKLDADMAEEMRLHLERRVEENVAGGMSPEEARYAARRKFGGVEQAKEIAREQRPWRWVEQAWQDLRYAARSLRKNPGFALVAVLTLAFGIGANTAIFSVFDAVLLKPLPYPKPEQLVSLTERHQKGYIRATSFPNFLDWREQSTAFQEIAAMRNLAYNLAGEGDPERVLAQKVSASFFPLLGVTPTLGRWFTIEEDRPGAEKVAIISHRLWQRRFAGNGNVVGQRLLLDGQSFMIVGVMPAGFRSISGGRFLSSDDTRELWTPLATDVSRNGRGRVFLRVIGRLRPGVSLEHAAEGLNAIAGRLAAQFPDDNAGFGIQLGDLHGSIAENAAPTVRLLLGAVALLLALVCANVANLFLIRAASRTGELTLRAALGASRARIVRQLLTESALVAVSGGVLGVLLGWWGIELLRRFLPQNQVPLRTAEINATVVGFTVAISLVTGLVFGLAPAFYSARANLNDALKGFGKGTLAGGRSRLRNGLVVAEVALAFVLLVGTSLVVKSLAHLLQVNPGFRADHVTAMSISLPDAKYAESSKVFAFYADLLTRLRALPGVESTGGVSSLPMSGSISTVGFAIEGRPEIVGAANYTDFQTVAGDYFGTLGIPLLKGRLFNETDHERAPLVAVVNRQLAATFWPGEDPVGRIIRLSGQPHEIVGIVGDVRQYGLNANVRAETYVPQTQRAERAMTLAVRSPLAPAILVEMIRSHVRQLDPTVPLADVRTLEAAVAGTTSDSRAMVLLLGVFSVAALVLAALGLYGVIAFSVANRVREIGIRFALGAQPADVRRTIVQSGLWLVLGGVVIGLAVSLVSSRLLTGLLYEVHTADPLIYLAVSIALVAVALLALAVPIRRAAKIDPMVALRCE